MADLKLPAGWRINTTEPGAANLTQDDVDQFIDTYYRTGPGANLDAGDYSAHTATGAWDPAAAARGKASYMEEHPNFETTPFVPGAQKAAARQATIGELSPGWQKSISDAFTAYGADPTKHSADIESRLAKIIAGIPADATDLDKYFADQGVGNKLISELEPGYRTQAKSAFEAAAPKSFVPLTADDALIESIVNEDRATADKYIQNMVDRGQIIGAGADAARTDLNRQAGLGRTRLSEIGTGLIGTEEGTLGSERAKRLSAYDQLKLDQPYDVGGDVASLNKLASDFIGTLGTGLRTGLGSTPLFSTTGLGAIAGAAQGGQNTAFTPSTGGGATVPPEAQMPIEDQTKLGQDVLF